VKLVRNREGLSCNLIYPYDSVGPANRVQLSLNDTFHVTDIVFEFMNALLVNSTHTYKRVEFDGPLRYNYLY
jgi:hypothetical protein